MRPFLLSYLLIYFISVSTFVSANETPVIGETTRTSEIDAIETEETTKVNEALKGTKVIKVCSAKPSMPSEDGTLPKVMPIQIEIRTDKEGQTLAVTTLTLSGHRIPTVENVQVYSNQKIRIQKLLSSTLDDIDLSLAERVVLYAMGLVEGFNGFFNVGFDLKEVRTATVYVVGKMGNGDPQPTPPLLPCLRQPNPTFSPVQFLLSPAILRAIVCH